MTNKFFNFAVYASILAASQGINAQNLMENATIHVLGEPKTWVNNAGDTYVFDPSTLEDALDPTNQKNIYLFPEGGYDTEANRAIGIQGFYVDLMESKAVGVVTTTWEGAAANAYSIYVTDEEPTIAILEETPTYTATGLGQYQNNNAVLPDNTQGRYVVFQPTDATNYGWGVKIRSISAVAPQIDELMSFSIEPTVVLQPDTKLTFTFLNQFGLPIDAKKVKVECDVDTYNAADNTLTLEEGTEATFTASLNGKSLSCTVSHPKLELTFFSIEPAFIFEDDSKLSFRFHDQFGSDLDADMIKLTCDVDTFNKEEGTLSLDEGETATFTATLNGEEDALTFTVSHPVAPELPVDMTIGIYTKETPDVLWNSGYNAPQGEEPTLNKGTHEFENGELATLFHAAYCIFFYNDITMAEYGAWNAISFGENQTPATALGRYLNLQVYSSRPSHCSISFNDNTPNQFNFELPHDDWSDLSVDMEEVDNMRNMSIRFPETKDLDCVLLSNIYFSDVATGKLPIKDNEDEDPDISTGVDSVNMENGQETVNVYNFAGVLLKNNVNKAEALDGLGKGLYIVGGKKVVK